MGLQTSKTKCVSNNCDFHIIPTTSNVDMFFIDLRTPKTIQNAHFVPMSRCISLSKSKHIDLL